MRRETPTMVKWVSWWGNQPATLLRGPACFHDVPCTPDSSTCGFSCSGGSTSSDTRFSRCLLQWRKKGFFFNKQGFYVGFSELRWCKLWNLFELLEEIAEGRFHDRCSFRLILFMVLYLFYFIYFYRLFLLFRGFNSFRNEFIKAKKSFLSLGRFYLKYSCRY